jgi:hypothetical protein
MASAPPTISKVPPPVSYVGEFPDAKQNNKTVKVKSTSEFNRWLLTLTSFVNQAGLISGSVVDLTSNSGFETVVTTVNTLSTDVSALQTEVTTISGEITNINNAIAAIPIVRNGSGSPSSGLGNTNDWYADTVGKHIYVKTAVATWTLIL